MTTETFHLSEERIQALLDGQLPAGDAARAREHAQACARCRARMEAWETLFGSLGALPELTPGADFGDRVLAGLASPERVPLGARVRGWLRATSPDGHPGDGRLQALLDGRLGGRAAARVEGHLAACDGCRREIEALAGVVAALERLPRYAPAEGFAERVMAAVRVPEPAGAWVRARRLVMARVREVASLRTRRAWAALAGVAFTPGLVAAMVAWVVFSHPLVTVGSLASFLWIEGSQLASAVGAWLTATALNSGPLAASVTALRGVSVAPGTAVAGFIVFSALTVLAVWVLYTNVVAPRAVEGRYAKLQA